MMEDIIGELLFYCGALHDIAEKSEEATTKKQLRLVELKIEAVLLRCIDEYDQLIYQEIMKLENVVI